MATASTARANAASEPQIHQLRFQLAHNGEQRDSRDAAQQHGDQAAPCPHRPSRARRSAWPGRTCARGHSSRSTRAGTRAQSQQHVLEPVDESLHRFESRDTLSEIAHAGGPAQIQKQKANGRGIEKFPENEPVAAFEVGIRNGPWPRGESWPGRPGWQRRR